VFIVKLYFYMLFTEGICAFLLFIVLVIIKLLVMFSTQNKMLK